MHAGVKKHGPNLLRADLAQYSERVRACCTTLLTRICIQRNKWSREKRYMPYIHSLQSYDWLLKLQNVMWETVFTVALYAL